jgi:decaprenylphospho-beta-D-ribofuranose 2-oxidase
MVDSFCTGHCPATFELTSGFPDVINSAVRPRTTFEPKTEISGWGGYPRGQVSLYCPAKVSEALPPYAGSVIVRGLGRSYGDAAISTTGLVMLSERLNRVARFDEQTGLLQAEAGTTIADILDEFVPRGWFPPVVPGTKFVSLGGSVAADIHGKNHHHAGTFGRHVTRMQIVGADRATTDCSPDDEPELFWATVGGMGLTGIITAVDLQLLPIESPYMVVRHTPAKDLDALLSMLEGKQWDDDYTVAWIDCVTGRGLGRSVLIRGHHAKHSDLPPHLREKRESPKNRQHKLSFGFPPWALNRFTMAAFNETFYGWQGRRKGPFIDTFDRFFFPLDRIENWNRMYGKKGFVQYQCVLPLAESERGLQELLAELVRSRRSSFLSVLKRFGPAGSGLLSFPLAGHTLTLDFPIRDEGLFPFLDRLDEIVLRHAGRVYLAKDARMHPETFRAMYPRFPEWQRLKSRIDPDNRFDSDLARRLRIGSA